MLYWNHFHIFNRFTRGIGCRHQRMGKTMLGGIADAFQSAPMIVSTLRVKDGGWRLRAELPLASDACQTRGWYFPASATASTGPIELPRMLFSLSTYRDVAGMWQARDELFDEDVYFALQHILYIGVLHPLEQPKLYI